MAYDSVPTDRHSIDSDSDSLDLPTSNDRAFLLDQENQEKLQQSAGKFENHFRRNFLRYFLCCAGLFVAFVLFFVGYCAYLLIRLKKARSAGTKLLLISLDAFRADFILRDQAPTLYSLAQKSTWAPYMTPVFPSVTFPNHETMVTGLYPASHGIIGNEFWDPATNSNFTIEDSNDAKWWTSEPIWIAAQKSGINSAVSMWPGSDAIQPKVFEQFSWPQDLSTKVNTVQEWFKHNDFVSMYIPDIDVAGHEFGPDSREVNQTIANIDNMIKQILKKIDTKKINVVIVSDHGIAPTAVSRIVEIEQLVDWSGVSEVSGWPVLGLWPAQNITKTVPGVTVYQKDELPSEYHFSGNERIAPTWLVPDAGYIITTPGSSNIIPLGAHGYEPNNPLMRSLFIASGPAFKKRLVQPFSSVEVYGVLCKTLKLHCPKNNGTMNGIFQDLKGSVNLMSDVRTALTSVKASIANDANLEDFPTINAEDAAGTALNATLTATEEYGELVDEVAQIEDEMAYEEELIEEEAAIEYIEEMQEIAEEIEYEEELAHEIASSPAELAEFEEEIELEKEILEIEAEMNYWDKIASWSSSMNDCLESWLDDLFYDDGY